MESPVDFAGLADTSRPNLQLRRFRPVDPLLCRVVDFFWVLRSDGFIRIDHKLLPVNSVDLVLNLSAPIRYVLNEEGDAAPPGIHCLVLPQRYCMIRQAGKLAVLGASLLPGGLHSLLRLPVGELSGRLLDLDEHMPGFTAVVAERVRRLPAAASAVKTFADELRRRIVPERLPDREIQSVLRAFQALPPATEVHDFCRHHGIHPRRLQRIFAQYVGRGPKAFLRIARFHHMLRHILCPSPVTMTASAQWGDFFDQTHFTKDFKALAGCPPARFLAERRSVKEILPPTPTRS